MQKQKVLFIIDRLGAGAGRVVYDLAAFLDREKFTVAVAPLYPEGDLTDFFRQHNIRILSINKRPGKDLGLICRLADAIRRENSTLSIPTMSMPMNTEFWQRNGQGAKK